MFFKDRQPLVLWKYWFVLACALMVLITWLSLANLQGVNISGSDKFWHGFAYWVVALWWMQLFRQRWVMLILVVLVVAFGAGMEAAQAYHPMRHFDWWDMLANAIGAIIAFVMALLGFNNILAWFERVVLRLGR